MKKRYLLALGMGALLAGVLGVSACTNGSDVAFSVDGEKVPQTLEAELGDLFVIPQIVAVKDGKELPVDVSVVDSTQSEVALINQKFKATDINGYTLTFTVADGETSKECVIRLGVKDTQAPTFSIQGTSGAVVLLNEEVAIPECIVNDASSDSLTATYTVKDVNGSAVEVTDGKFTAATVGDYTITYTASDASGNEGKKDFTVCCKKAVVLNGFEKLTDFTWAQFDVANKEVVSDPARNGNAVKVELSDPQSSSLSWRRICVPFQKEDGSYWTWEELQKMEKLQCYVYSSVANELGLMTFTRQIDVGWNTVSFTIAEIAAILPTNPAQYEENANGLFLNLRYATAGSFMVFDHMIGIYADDYVPEPTFTLDGGGQVPEKLDVNMDETFTLPTVLAFRDDISMTVSATVTDSTGAEVTLTDNAFAATDLEGYTVTYTATDDSGSKSISIAINVIDTRIPQITVNATRNVSVVGATFAIPESTTVLENEELTATVTVKDPNGDPVTVTDGTFVTELAGEYILLYEATSEESGNKGSTEFIVTCKEGKLLNGFDSVDDITYISFEATKERVSAQGVYGVKVTRTAEEITNWQSVRIPFANFFQDGPEYLTWDDLQDFARIDFYIVASANMNLGLANGVKAVPAGASVLSFTIGEIKTAYASGQYSENANGFYFNIQTIAKDAYIIFENVIAVYPEGYKPAVSATLSDGSALPERFSATLNQTFEIPQIKAIRKKATEEMTVTVKVLDGTGAEVSAETSFTATDLEGYVLVYTATDALGSEEIRIPVRVIDDRLPQIEVEGAAQLTVYKNDEVTVPASTVTFEDVQGLEALIAISDPKGNAVEATDGKFTASLAGDYVITYSFTAENGNRAEDKTVTVTCVNGKLLNAFNAVNCVEWCAGAPIKELTDDGVKVSWTAQGFERVCIPFRHADNTYFTWEELISYERIEFKIFASAACQYGLISGSTLQPVAAGENVIVFTRDALIAQMAESTSTYSADGNGLYTTLDSRSGEVSLTFMSVVGYYAEEEETNGGQDAETPEPAPAVKKEDEIFG